MSIRAIEVYFFCLENPAVLDYYSEVIGGMNCLVWDAINIRRNMEIANWPNCLPLIGWHGCAVMLPGT